MSEPHQRIIDSHIHLWPSTATSPSAHGWMKPGHFLSKRHGITDYLRITSPFTSPRGFIYVETDRYLPSPFPPISSSSSSSSSPAAQQDHNLTTWAQQPLQELLFLRRIAEVTHTDDNDDDDDGFTPSNASKMLGCVIFAPFHLPHALFSRYLEIARERAGPVLWSKVVGFRYLLQGKGEGGVKKLLEEGEWVENLKALGRQRGGKGAVFEVGVDGNRDGWEGLGEMSGVISRVREGERKDGVERGKGVRFVLSKFFFLLFFLLLLFSVSRVLLKGGEET